MSTNIWHDNKESAKALGRIAALDVARYHADPHAPSIAARLPSTILRQIDRLSVVYYPKHHCIVEPLCYVSPHFHTPHKRSSRATYLMS